MDLPTVRPHEATRPPAGSDGRAVRSSPVPHDPSPVPTIEENPSPSTAPRAETKETDTTRKAPEPAEVERDVELANELASRMNVSIGFRTFQEDGEVIVEVTNRETGELIRRVPPEDLTDRLTRFQGFEGLLTQAKV